MCGITGIFDTQGSGPISRSALSRMNQAQAHRGPDGDQLFVAPGIGLGHRRLAVIDLATGQQPLGNADGSVVVVCNGEIYNYRELRTELQGLGHVFHTASDTEVLVHGWERWGAQCLQRLRGMFAFALWDRNQHTLFLARDRLGVKPLCYAFLDNGLLLFGSEPKALLAHGALPRDLAPEAVEEYFALGYVAEPRNIFQAVRTLPAGHTLTVRRGLPPLQPQCYWDLRFSPAPVGRFEDAQAELQERLREAVRLRMVADVPLGAFLSGGVDSSAVVALMAGLSQQPVSTCNMGFEEGRYDESGYALQVAERFQTLHHSQRVRLQPEAVLWPDTLARLYDEPFADSSAIPTYLVSQLARRHVTVALSGDGGDEAFGGYGRYRQHLRFERWRSSLPLWLRRPVCGLAAKLRPSARLDVLGSDAVGAYWHSVALMQPSVRKAVFSARLRHALGGYSALQVFHRHAARAQTDDPLALVQYLDYKTYLVGDINTKVDRASMAHALEVREPLMDHELVQWLAGLPSAWKVQGAEGKHLLKKTLEPLLPQDLLYRPKQGFAVPMAQWLRGPLQAPLEAALLGPRLLDTGWFERRGLQALLHSHASARQDHSAALWALWMFEAFLRQVVDAP